MENQHQRAVRVPTPVARSAQITAEKENPGELWEVALWMYHSERGTDISGTPPAENCRARSPYPPAFTNLPDVP